MNEHYGCPVQATVNLLSGKWKVQILWHLSFHPYRFAELRKKLPRISEKILTEQLRLLEDGRLVHREVAPTNPPTVTYSLQAEAESLVPLMETMCDWGSAHFQMKPSLPRRPSSGMEENASAQDPTAQVDTTALRSRTANAPKTPAAGNK